MSFVRQGGLSEILPASHIKVTSMMKLWATKLGLMEARPPLDLHLNFVHNFKNKTEWTSILSCTCNVTTVYAVRAK